MKLSNQPIESKQLAVLFADIVEYSKLTHQDQVGTHNSLTDRFEIVRKIVAQNDGDIVRMIGDGLFVTFENARNAIYCAAEIQRASDIHNLKIAADEQLMFRIGISYGEVICEGGEPFGNPVNISKRLEELARPRSIYVSDEAYQSLGFSVPFRTNYRGKIRIKNIEEPVIVFEIVQHEPLSFRPNPKTLFNHPIDKSFVGTISIVVLVSSFIVLLLSLAILFSVLSIV